MELFILKADNSDDINNIQRNYLSINLKKYRKKNISF